MGLENVPVEKFLVEAFRRPDGIVAYAFSAIGLLLMVTAPFALRLFGDTPVVRHFVDGAWLLVLLPFVMFVMYCGIRFLAPDTVARNWLNALGLCMIGCGFVWLVIYK